MITDRMTGCGRAGGWRRAWGFTLVELLVTIALLGILLSLAGPALAKVHGKAKEIQCLNNLRNLGIAQTMYANDYRNRLVPHAVLRPAPPQALVPNEQMTFWPDLLAPYAGDDRSFRCPCMRCDPERGVGYGLNLKVARAFLVSDETYGTHERLIKNPAQTVLIADAAFITPATHQGPPAQWEEAIRPLGAWTIRTPDDPLWSLAPARVMPRHLGRANALFVDGHAESLTIPGLQLDKPVGHPKNIWDRR
tara:strand:- start:15 stop:764 length:750 start_codon:yes stop_codon:yes gene_type:complete